MSETIQAAAMLTDLALRYLCGLMTKGEYDLSVAYVAGYEDGTSCWSERWTGELLPMVGM